MTSPELNAQENVEPEREVDSMPRFPGCEDVDGEESDKYVCAQEKLLNFVFENVKYPQEAKEKGVQGTVYTSFTVSAKGKIADIKVLRDPGEGIGEEAKRVIELMNEMDESWTPAYKDDKAVATEMVMPIKFDLSTDKQTDDVKKKE